MARIERSDVGRLSTASSSKAPVSANRLDDVQRFASCPVASSRLEIDGMPYAYTGAHSRSSQLEFPLSSQKIVSGRKELPALNSANLVAVEKTLGNSR